MNVLVTGASGQLGLSVKDASLCSDHDFFFTDILPQEEVSYLDITDKDSLMNTLSDKNISVIVNCAAYTDVDGAEYDEETAFIVNGTAPGILAEAAREVDALLIHVSTDYVFDGTSCRPYLETDECSPANVYGRSKLAGESAVIASGCRHVILRTSWLYSNYGRNFYRTMVDLTASCSVLKVISDQVGTPTWASDLAEAIVGIVESGNTCSCGVYNFSDEGACSWYDFAKEICSGLGYLCDIRPCRSEEYPTLASRPHYSVLDKTKFKETFGMCIPHWRESLQACIALRRE